MLADALQLHMPSIQKKAPVRIKSCVPESKGTLFLLPDFSGAHKTCLKRIEGRLLHIPQDRLFHQIFTAASLVFDQLHRNFPVPIKQSVRDRIRLLSAAIPIRFPAGRYDSRHINGRFHPEHEILPLPSGADINAVFRNTDALRLLHPHVTVDPRTGIPSAVGRLKTCADQNLILSLPDMLRDLDSKSRIPVLPFRRLIPIHIDDTVHIDTLKNKKKPFRPIARPRKVLSIPSGSILIKTVRIVNQPVMRDIHRHEILLPAKRIRKLRSHLQPQKRPSFIP